MRSWLPEVAHWMGLAPLVWVSFVRPSRFYWVLAFAFAVSFVADTVAHWVDPQLVSVVYPVSQAGIAGIALLDGTRDAAVFIGALVWAGLVALILQDVARPDVLLSTVAFGSVAGLALSRWALGRVRTALLVYFGLGLACWWAFAAWPSWTTYTLYQSVRAIGLGWFCYAAWKPGPVLLVLKAK